ncbi:MAG: ATP-binding protein [Burkholderiales bacterium]
MAWLVAAACTLFAGPVSGAPVAQTLATARLAISPSTVPPADGEPVTLPDDWQKTRPSVRGYGWYLFDWTRPPDATDNCAVYVTGTLVPVEVYVNGRLIGATGNLAGVPINSWQGSPLYAIPAGFLVPGTNRIALRVLAGNGVRLPRLGPIMAGPEPALRERAVRDLLLHTLAPIVVSVTIVVLGIFILVLWMRRRDPTYGLFGFAAILWGLHTGLTQLPNPLLPMVHWIVWWNALYMLFVGLLCLFCLRFAEVDWPWFRRLVVGFVAVVPAVLYTALALGFGTLAGILVRLTGIGIVLVALVAVARYALRKRDAESVLLLLAGTLSAGFAVHDWWIAQDTTQVRPLWLVPYAGLGFLLLVGWILTDRFVRALNEAESLNANLEQRVAEKGEALAAQLAETRVARDAAETANRAKTRFLAAASHDLRQPLHALGLFATRLAERVRAPEEAALAQRILTSVTSLDSLFAALLDISRLEAGAVAAAPRAVALAPLLDRMANDFAPEAIERNLRFAVVPTRLAVHSDPVLLERIVRNLIANALFYTRSGGVVIGARRRGPGRVAIEVWDTGPGIAGADVERIFEEFYQVGNQERDRARGLGLGLAIVQRLARLLGHDVEVQSTVGRGSVFRVVARTAPADAVAPDEHAAIVPDALAGHRILVVEDEEAVREGMRQTLEAWGCAPLIAAGVDDAVTLACAGAAPDAVVVDYRLPGGRDGLAAIAAVRAACQREIPAVIVSGESSSAELARVQAAGIPLLQKPASPAKLRAMLDFLLKRARQAA